VIGIAGIRNNRLFVVDTANERVIVYNTTTITNGMNAANVLGQTNFTTVTVSGATQASVVGTATTNGTYSAFYDPGSSRLFVTDGNNNRVMIFDCSAFGPTPGYD
jgi:hypothetical protein